MKRAEKGYVIIPPSPGYVYILGGPHRPLPQWLIDELVMEELAAQEASRPKYFIQFQNGTPYGLAALRNTLERLSNAADGTRNDELNKAAFNLAGLWAGGELSRDAALQGLLDTAHEIGLTSFEARNTIESGWTAGEQVPRQAPKASS